MNKKIIFYFFGVKIYAAKIISMNVKKENEYIKKKIKRVEINGGLMKALENFLYLNFIHLRGDETASGVATPPILLILCCIVGVGEEDEVKLAVPILGTGFGWTLMEFIELSGDSASAVYVLFC
jgi:hypothetical protein